MSDHNGPRDEQWKRKYFQSLQDLEEKEKEWAATDAALRRGISRLSLAADGRNAEVDAQLDQLRNSARSERDIRRLLRVIDGIVAAAEEASGTAGADVDTGVFVNELLARLEFVDAEHSDVVALQRRAAVVRDRGQLVEVVGDVAALIAERVDSRPVSAQAVCQLTPLHEILIQLLERLDLSSDLAAEAEALKDQWARGLAEEELHAAFEAIARLVGRMRSSADETRRDFESFLLDLTARLKELDAHLQGANSVQTESMDDGHRLDAVVREQVDDIHNALTAATHLGQLKDTIRDRLETIRSHMRSYVAAEEQRHRVVEEQLQALSGRMRAMEAEATTLRSRVIETHQRALMDPLTGVYNRLAYDERMAQEYARWKRYGSPLAVIVWDVDHFKRINDRFGHRAGDKALKTIARLIGDRLRQTDFFARYGGEEFVALLPETDMRAAQAVAEKVRTAVAASEFHYGNQPVKITVSCGVATFRDPLTPEAVFEQADRRLYQSKQSGRNRCTGEDTA